MYIANASKYSNCPQIPSQSIYFSKFSGRGIPQTLTIGKLCILIVLCTINSYSQSKASFYLCDHTRFRKLSRKLPMGMMYFEQLSMYISDCAPPFGIPRSTPASNFINNSNQCKLLITCCHHSSYLVVGQLIVQLFIISEKVCLAGPGGFVPVNTPFFLDTSSDTVFIRSGSGFGSCIGNFSLDLKSLH